MELQHLNIDELKLTALNVRKKGAKEVADLVSSIRSNGVLQPLLVRPNCEGYEIVAGQRRYHALLALADEGDTEPVPCIVMDSKDDVKAIEASLAENIARLPMDEIDQYKAFAALAKQGLTPEDIASQFGITERLVKQRLALGNLHAPILTAYRNEDISAQTLRFLTMATPKQQRAWWELAKSEEYTPTGNRLKEWLFGGNDVSVENALFDVADYDGAMISDLFGEDTYFDNAETFWAMQNQAIAKAQDAYLADGWGEVEVLDIGESWPQWNFTATAKEEGGRVYVQISNQGEVCFHEGYLTEKEAKRKQAKEDGTPPAPKSELTKAMQNYLSLHRHSAVRATLLDHSGIALRLAVAQMIAASDLWSVQADPQKANTEAIKDSLATNKAQDAFATERKAVRELLETSDKDDKTIVPLKEEWRRVAELEAIFAKLVSLDDVAVSRILTFVVAETLPSGSAMVEILGNMFKVDMVQHWQPDEAFFDLLRDKQAVNAMLKDIGGKHVAESNITSTAKVQKKIIKDFLSSKRTAKKQEWKPRYMAFPMQAYTKKGGINAIESWKKVKKNFDG